MQVSSVDIPFDAIFTLLIFLIGIPALIFQFMTPDIRRIVSRRRWWLAADVFLPLGVALFVSMGGIFAEFYFGDLDPYDHSLRWVFIFSALTIITLIIGIRIPMRYGRREAIVKTVKNEIRRSLKKQGRVADVAWEDLVDLGKNAMVPQERQEVLLALRELAGEIYHRPDYQGDGLESLLMGMVDILAQGGETVSGDNYQLAAAILQDVVLNGQGVDPSAASDLRRAIKAAAEIGRIALSKFDSGLEGNNVVLKFVEVLGLVLLNPAHSALTSDVTEALFDVGSLAFEMDRSLIGLATLDKMVSSLFLPDGFSAEQKNEQIADTLGLMAHCWEKGSAHRQIISNRLPEIQSCFEQPLSSMFARAYDYYLDRAKPETASKLVCMAADLKASFRSDSLA